MLRFWYIFWPLFFNGGNFCIQFLSDFEYKMMRDIAKSWFFYVIFAKYVTYLTIFLVVFKLNRRSFIHHIRRFSMRIVINNLPVSFGFSQVLIITSKTEGF